MLPKDLIKKIRRIEIRTRNLVNDVFSGQYKSIFKGRGMEFSEVREYQPGDDIKIIDWNVTARAGKPYVKVFDEERELTVILMVDASSSGEFGTTDRMKGEIAAEICALLALSAIKNNDKVGLLIFTDQVEKFIPPKKGKEHVLRVVRELLYFRPVNQKTDINCALEYVGRVINRKSIMFLVSDFYTSGYEKALKIANKKHDIIAVVIRDPREMSLPDVGYVVLEDAETGEEVMVDTSSLQVRNAYSMFASRDREELSRIFLSCNIDSINIDTDKSYVEPLVKFFQSRAKKII